MDLSRIEWRKASYSANGGGNCVEVGATGRLVAVRDSKDPEGPPLLLTPADWQSFTDSVKAGVFDLT